MDCIEIARLLLEEGVDINSVDLRESPTLGRAAEPDKIEVPQLIVNHIAKLKSAVLYVSPENLQLKSDFINNSQDRYNNYSQHFQKCKEEIKKLAKENKPLHNFFKESNINRVVSIWEENENVRNKFDDPEGLKEQYPEYAHMLINKANDVKKRIFLYNNKSLIDILSKHYGCDFSGMTFTGIKIFFEVHREDFREKLKESVGITLINFVNFEDVKIRHDPDTLKVRAFKQVTSNIDNTTAEQQELVQHLTKSMHIGSSEPICSLQNLT